MSDPSASEAGAVQRRQCPGCGTMNTAAARFCKKCNTELRALQPRAATLEAQAKAERIAAAIAQQVPAASVVPPELAQDPPGAGEAEAPEQSGAPAAAPLPPREPVFELEARTYVCVRDIQHPVNGMTITLPKGKLIDDPYLIGMLLRTHAPIAPAREGQRFVKCDHCGNLLQIETADGRTKH